MLSQQASLDFQVNPVPYCKYGVTAIIDCIYLTQDVT
jgi:hypothetical protein